MASFQPTHKLIAPAGEEIPVMLVSCSEHPNYLVITEIEHESGTDPFYQWHPYQGVTYNGFQLGELEILPLNFKKSSERQTENKSNIYAVSDRRLMVL